MLKKVLIADDEEKVRRLIKTTLELENKKFEIFEAKNGNEAVIISREMKPDLLILDVMMPGKSGYEVCKELKQYPETRSIYILFLTARGGEISERTMKSKGGDGYMAKPFSPKELSQKIKDALGVL